MSPVTSYAPELGSTMPPQKHGPRHDLPAARPGSLLRAAGTPSDPIERAVAEVQAKAERERLQAYVQAAVEEGFERALLEADPHGDLLGRYRFERWLGIEPPFSDGPVAQRLLAIITARPD